ncbi:aldo/keto reductase [Haloglomus litoreum]|uniref:aldo/keto reductase n=1 Tax=Haloglomus litoreum TaxID=3034026 RepID=UPI0023E7606D|nr:aldo/keto reductase [Haloglomus sp. DT116]
MTDDAPAPTPEDVPALGLGTWKLTGDTATEVVTDAVEAGYRHVDTAQLYDNELEVGRGLRAADTDIDADEVFLATKVAPENCSYEDCVSSVRASKDRLGRTPNLVYVHWPRAAYDAAETSRALDDLVDEGTTRAIGVSNFTVELLDEFLTHAEHAPLAHQFECHPLLPQDELVDACHERDVLPVAYSPVARGKALEHPVVQEVADEVDATPGQVCLAWLRARNVAAIPKTTGGHLAENLQSRDVVLSDEQVERISAIEERHRCVNPPSAPWD